MGVAFSSTDQEDITPYLGGGPDGEVITPFTCCFNRRSDVDKQSDFLVHITTSEQMPGDFNDPIFMHFRESINSDYDYATIDGRKSPLHWA